MSNPEFKHLKNEQLKKRVKIISVFVCLFAAIGVASFVFFFVTDYKFNWSWLLIGLTYILLTINYAMRMRLMRKEILFRDKRQKQKQEKD